MPFSIKLQPIRIPPRGLHLIAKAKINGKSARLVVDTGASQTVLDISRIKRFTAERNFVKHESHSSGIGSNAVESHLFYAGRFHIGNCIFRNLELVLIDMVHVNTSYALMGIKPVDGVLGGDILNTASCMIDYKKQVMILRPSAKLFKKDSRDQFLIVTP